MLLNFDQIFKKYNMNVRGVCQVGSHHGQEYGDYVNHGINRIIFIEPGVDAFKVLKDKFGGNADILLFNTACGDGGEGEEKMAYVEHTNQGMSSSLLAPEVHLTQHKEVVFDSTEMWKVARLDDLPFDRSKYNLLNLDCQGYEGKILKGASETLRYIDYIITEVNREFMYKDCALVEDIDLILSDFSRVETGWASPRHGWGDSLYVRKTLLNAE